MDAIEHSFPMCNVCEMPHNGYEGPCLEPGCLGHVTWEATADRLYGQLQGAVEALLVAHDALDYVVRTGGGWTPREALTKVKAALTAAGGQ